MGVDFRGRRDVTALTISAIVLGVVFFVAVMSAFALSGRFSRREERDEDRIRAALDAQPWRKHP